MNSFVFLLPSSSSQFVFLLLLGLSVCLSVLTILAFGSVKVEAKKPLDFDSGHKMEKNKKATEKLKKKKGKDAKKERSLIFHFKGNEKKTLPEINSFVSPRRNTEAAKKRCRQNEK